MAFTNILKSISLSVSSYLVSSTLSTVRPAAGSALATAGACPTKFFFGGDSRLHGFRLGRSYLQSRALDSTVIVLRSPAVIPRRIRGSLTRSRAYIQEVNPSADKMVFVRDSVELTAMEKRIFGILTATLQHFGLKTQLRVAGGWVRDKLLGRHSKDIDIAIDDMLGRVFCEKVNEYLQTIGKETHTVGVIQSNPDQSKHLETANMRVLGMSIDFVNLRAESYTETSRIPEMEFGTPEQDAYRRDLTINSLFYNINSGMVEDFTRQGITDLKNGIIRTPLPPGTTFLDDPLRVCRAIRFGARLEFTMDAELRRAATSEAVKIALENKISRERIGHEIELMLLGNQPVKAMRSVEELHLFPVIFRVPKEADPPIPENYGRFCVDALQAATQLLGAVKYAPELNNDLMRLLLLGALFMPLHSYSFPDKKRTIPVSTYIIRDSLKLRATDATGVEELYSSALKFKSITKQLLKTRSKSPEDKKDIIHLDNLSSAAVVQHRVDLGLLLIKIRDRWRCALLLASIMELQYMISEEPKIINIQTSIEEKAETCNFVDGVVRGLGLTYVWESKPLLDGNEIMAALNMGKGKHVQEWKERVLQWQLAHPSGTAEECHEWILEENVKRHKSE